MLSEYTWSAISFSLETACTLCILRMDWHSDMKILSIANGSVKRLISLIVTYLLIGNAVFRIWRITDSLLFHFNPNNIFIQFFYVSSSLLALAFNIQIYFYSGEYRQLITYFCRLETQLTDAYQIKEYRGEIPRRGAKFFFYLFVVQSIAQLQMYFEKTTMPSYLYSMFYTSDDGFIYKLLFAIPELLGIAFFWSQFAIFALPGLSVLCGINFWVNQQSYFPIGEIVTSEECRRFPIACKTYRCLQIICTCFNESYSVIMIAQKIFTMTLAATSLYGSVRLFGDINLMSYALMPLTFVACTAVGIIIDPRGYIIERDIYRFKLAWQHGSMIDSSMNVANVNAFLRSANVMTVEFGGFYKFGRNTVMTFVSSIIDWALSLLLAF